MSATRIKKNNLTTIIVSGRRIAKVSCRVFHRRRCIRLDCLRCVPNSSGWTTAMAIRRQRKNNDKKLISVWYK